MLFLSHNPNRLQNAPAYTESEAVTNKEAQVVAVRQPLYLLTSLAETAAWLSEMMRLGAVMWCVIFLTPSLTFDQHSLSSPSLTRMKSQSAGRIFFLDIYYFKKMESKFKNGNLRQLQSRTYRFNINYLHSNWALHIICMPAELFLHLPYTYYSVDWYTDHRVELQKPYHTSIDRYTDQ